MNPTQKYKLFEYMIDGIVAWYNDVQDGIDVCNELNRLKLIKLNFFVSAASTDGKKIGLLEHFDKFYAMPFGHVESDIYDHVKILPYHGKYILKKDTIEINKVPGNYYDEIDRYKSEVDDAIYFLSRKNPHLVKYKSFDLVELSHEWSSWKLVFNMAKSKGMNSMLIPNQIIINENKFFHLKSFMNVH